MEILILLVVLLALDIAAWQWGFDSTDGPLSPEWERRHRYDYVWKKKSNESLPTKPGKRGEQRRITLEQEDARRKID